MPINNPVAHYPFDGNTNDASANGDHGQIHGNPSFVSGVVGEAIQFNGVDSYVEVASGLNFLGNYSLSLYFKEGSRELSIVKGEACPTQNPSYKGTAHTFLIDPNAVSYTPLCPNFSFKAVAWEPGELDNVQLCSHAAFSAKEFAVIALVFSTDMLGSSTFNVYLNGNLFSHVNQYRRGNTETQISPSEFSLPLHETTSSLTIGPQDHQQNVQEDSFLFTMRHLLIAIRCFINYLVEDQETKKIFLNFLCRIDEQLKKIREEVVGDDFTAV